MRTGGEIIFPFKTSTAFRSFSLGGSSSVSWAFAGRLEIGDAIPASLGTNSLETLHSPKNEHSFVAVVGTFSSCIASAVRLATLSRPDLMT